MSDTKKRDAVLWTFDCSAPYSPAEKNMADHIVRLELILAALREPSEGVKAAFDAGSLDGSCKYAALRAAVAAAEQEVG